MVCFPSVPWARLGARIRLFFAPLLTALLLAPPATAGQVYIDTFNGSLNLSWTWQNPGRTSRYTVTHDRLQLAVGKSNDQWVGIDKAPRLLTDAPGTPAWTIETRVLSNTGGPTTFAGLVVFASPQYWFLWGQLGSASLEGSGIIGNAFTGATGIMATRFPYLRIRRVHREYLDGTYTTYFFDASADGVQWTNANVFIDRAGVLDGAKVGLLAKNWSRKAEYRVEFDYFRADDDDPMPSIITGILDTDSTGRSVSGPSIVAQVTGEGAINNTSNVDFCGGDLGEMFDWNGRTYVAFGDTFGCRRPELWRSNTLAYVNQAWNPLANAWSDPPFETGLYFNGWITEPDPWGGARVKQLFGPDDRAITAIPTSGVAVGDRAYLYYMQVTNWSPWTCDRSSIASATDPEHWTKHRAVVEWDPGNFNMVGILRDPERLPAYLYILGTPCGRYGSIKLMRVAEDRVLTRSAYQYFTGVENGQQVWSSQEAEAVTVAGGPAGELSVRWNAWLNRYILTYLDEPKGRMVVREAPQPWGPWSAPVPFAAYDDYPLMYGAFMKPGYDENNGETVYYMMSLWGPYNTFWMKLTFLAPQP